MLNRRYNETMKPAPDFTLPDQNGTNHSLRDHRGQWVVVYFYPKDDTPGCTTEACSFRDGRDHLEKHHVKVFGISADSVASHKKFADKYSLNFTLLSDRDRSVMKAYGAVGDKSMFGRTFLGIKRNTYLINPEGQIAKEYLDVKPEEHALEILKDIQTLSV
jgi:peroxiredoxin Q/BCP